MPLNTTVFFLLTTPPPKKKAKKNLQDGLHWSWPRGTEHRCSQVWAGAVAQQQSTCPVQRPWAPSPAPQSFKVAWLPSVWTHTWKSARVSRYSLERDVWAFLLWIKVDSVVLYLFGAVRSWFEKRPSWNKQHKPGLMVHACNPSSLEGWDRRIASSRPPRAIWMTQQDTV